MKYNIAQLFEIVFGIGNVSAYNVGALNSLPQDVRHTYGIEKEASKGVVLDYSGVELVSQPHEAARMSYLGTPIILPITLKGKKYQVFNGVGDIELKEFEDFELPTASLVTMRHAKVMTKTKAAASKGTVKEVFGFDDWKIDIRGFCLKDPFHTTAKTAYEQKMKLFEYDQAVDSIEILSEVFNDLDVFNIAIEETTFTQLKGKPGVIPFHMRCVSDEPLDLIL